MSTICGLGSTTTPILIISRTPSRKRALATAEPRRERRNRPPHRTSVETADKRDTLSPSVRTRAKAKWGTSSPFALPQQWGAKSAATTTDLTAPNPVVLDASTSASGATTKTTSPHSANTVLGDQVTVPEKAQTPLRAEAFERLLADHPDAHLRRFISDTLRLGADIRYRGPQLSRKTPNSQSARIHQYALLQSVQKEVDLGHSVGPFPTPPFPHFVVNALGCRPKKDGGHRTIMDLSQPSGSSVNDHIDGREMPLQYCSVDDAVRLASSAGRYAIMGKMDIKSAFRLIPVRRADWNLLGYCLNGKYYFDIVLPFGCRSSPYIFEFFSAAVHWCVVKKSRLPSMLHYVDDYLFVGSPGTDDCSTLMTAMREVCEELGVPLALDKTEGPATRLIFLGIEIDSDAQTLSLPAGKLQEIKATLERWHERSSCTLTELQSLIGTLTFASKCLYTDASATLGLGAFCENEWFQSRWPEWLLQAAPSIEYLEMVPILLAVLAWAHLRSSSPGVLDLMRRMTWAAATNNLTLTLKHVRGVDNGIADALSRFQMERFRALATAAAPKAITFPDIFPDLRSTFRPTPRCTGS
ncbi:uncharacterized protein LOC129584213 [Paramacrobiotus metropolitanus]|uniref:uncharacterized protein LOC129584213 n=1 Tax=Paramacrobiotus metropolitanus TaxID=2943436 RepID=UPI002445BFB2|nr:uncharacterized protein LOC129584213 [Paramacrobiotus metropolitanus]